MKYALLFALLLSWTPSAPGHFAQSDKREKKGLNILLVTNSNQNRIDRIKELLEGNGFKFTSVSFSDVTTDECAKHDVLIVDSPNDEKKDLEKALRTRPDFEKLPDREMPMICVGFLGTQLLKAHKVGLSCGYI